MCCLFWIYIILEVIGYFFSSRYLYYYLIFFRSACYYTVKCYNECLSDIELAIEAGYPTHMVHKLYIRQCKCLLELCRIPQAQEAFDKAIDAIDRSGLKKDLRKVLLFSFFAIFKKFCAKGAYINNVGKILLIFDPPLPSVP